MDEPESRRFTEDEVFAPAPPDLYIDGERMWLDYERRLRAAFPLPTDPLPQETPDGPA